jgi:hypothetical protein
MAATPEINSTHERPTVDEFRAPAPHLMSELAETISQTREVIAKSHAAMAKADELLAKR